MEYGDYLTEETKARLESRGMDLRWAGHDQVRHEQWDHMFNPALCENEADKDFVDLGKDEVLNHYGVSARERLQRRYIAETVMENTVAAYHGQIDDPELMRQWHETTNKTDIAAHTQTALPMVRKYLPQQFLFEIVPVVPMTQATIRLFSFDVTYGTAGVYSAGTSIYGNPDPAYADDPGECEEPNEIDTEITGETVTAISKKLKGLWNIEAAQDAASYHRIVLQNEIVRMLGVEINREINRYGINQLVANVATTTNWNSTQPMASTNGWTNANPSQYNDSIWDAVEDANRAIKNAQFVDATYILCGTTFASRLRKLNGFRLNPGADALNSSVVTGPALFGTLNSRYRLYEDPEFPADKALIGHKGTWIGKTAAVYLPYVPAWRTPVIHNTTLCPGVGYLSRFGFKVINGNFLGMIVIS